MSTEFKVGDEVIRIGDSYALAKKGQKYIVGEIGRSGSLKLRDLSGSILGDRLYDYREFALVKPKFVDGYFKVNDEQHNKEIQEYLFSVGYSWLSGSGYLVCDASYLFISSLGRITYLEKNRDPSSHTKDIPEFTLNVEKTYTLKKVEKPQPTPETIEIGGVKYLKSDFENAVKGLTPC